jgi:hypothetical protein
MPHPTSGASSQRLRLMRLAWTDPIGLLDGLGDG